MYKIKVSIVALIAITAFSFKPPVNKKNITYTVDKQLSSATWVGKKVTGEHSGAINVSKGTIISDEKNLTGGNFEIDMNSITCTDLADKEYNTKLVNHLKADDFFGVEKFPAAQFVITKATLKSGNDYDVTGNLTIKGVTKEITFPAMVKMDEHKIVGVAKITVNRTDYGIKYGSANFFKSIGDKAINDDFELNVNIVATAH